MNPTGSCKAQKGWLSRWTRKQWSRHWFVLKNGSLTYYRGPAAELCSFLDGVLDLSLIKQIEVQPQQQLQQNNQHHHHLHHHSSNQNTANSNSNNNLNSHFNFSLKMWNGECHILGASSLLERSQWLDAINACTNGELVDEEATDSASSSSSSDSSPICSAGSGKSSSESLNLTATDSVSRSSSTISQQSLGGRNHHHHHPHPHAHLILHHPYHNSQRAALQQQQDAAAQLSLDRLAIKLKSAIRRRSEASNNNNNNNNQLVAPNVDVVLELEKSDTELKGNKKQENMTLIKPETTITTANFNLSSSHQVNHLSSQQDTNLETKSTLNISDQIESRLKVLSSNAADDEQSTFIPATSSKTSIASIKDHDQDSDDEDENKENQAFKRRLMCVKRSQDGSSLNNKVAKNQEPKLITCHRSPAANIDCKMTTSSSSSSSSENEHASGEDESDTSDFESASPLSKRKSTTTALGSPTSGAQANDIPPKESAPSEQKQKKRVTFDPSLIAVKMSSSSDSSSSTDDEDEPENEEDEEEEDDEAEVDTSEESSLSTTSSDENDDDDEDLHNDSKDNDTEHDQLKDTNNQLSSKVNGGGSSSKSSLMSPRTKSLFEDPDEDESTCEMVRQMIARRRLRSQNRDGDTVKDESSVSNADSASTMAMDTDTGSGATLPSSETTNKMMGENQLAQVTKLELEKLGGGGCEEENDTNRKLEELEESNAELSGQLKRACDRVGQLERKLCDSYANYNQLEVNYKRLQAELMKCNELHQDELTRMQSKLEELTRELATNELKLAEARDKMQKFDINSGSASGSGSQTPITTTTTSLGCSMSKLSSSNYHPQQNQNHHHHHSSRLGATSAKALNWLRASQQVSLSSPSSLLLMQQHHVKQSHSLVVNQQTLGLKLLNHSKQIQRRLNELEHKVDRMSQTTTTSMTSQATQQQQQQQQQSQQPQQAPSNEQITKAII